MYLYVFCKCGFEVCTNTYIYMILLIYFQLYACKYVIYVKGYFLQMLQWYFLHNVEKKGCVVHIFSTLFRKCSCRLLLMKKTPQINYILFPNFIQSIENSYFLSRSATTATKRTRKTLFRLRSQQILSTNKL